MWSVLGDAGDVRQSDERSTIIVALEEAGSDPLGPNQIAAATGMKAGNIRRLLGKMVSEGVVRKAGYGKYTLQPAA
jgi:DNA-binding IclR family transcriptional regulator